MNPRHLFLDLHGRIPRSAFWMGLIAIVFIQYAVQTPLMNAYGVDPDMELAPLWFRNLSLFLDIVSAWPLFAVLSKRQQDRNQGPNLSFTFVALLLIFSICEAFGLTQEGPQFTAVGWAVGLPLLGVLAVVIFELGFRRGTKGPNDFGPDPLQ